MTVHILAEPAKVTPCCPRILQIRILAVREFRPSQRRLTPAKRVSLLEDRPRLDMEQHLGHGSRHQHVVRAAV